MKNPGKPPPYASIPFSGGDLDPPALHKLYEDPFQPHGTTVFEQPITDH